MSDRASGGCLCGAIRYEIGITQARAVVCHCRQCQRQTGSAFSIVLVAPKSQLEVIGELATFADRAESGNAVLRKFCAKCGTPVLSEPSAMPQLVAIKAGTLDDVSALSPTRHLWCSSAQPWVKLPDDVPCLPRQ